jgi:aldose 1-epimerase
MTSSVTSRIFGFLPDGKAIEAWTLCGQGGLVLEVITYGAAVTRLLVPDWGGRVADVVLGFNHLDSYLADRAYFGAVIGRVAGRIPSARFNLEGRTYELAQNDPPNHLHGGGEGFNKKTWTASPMTDRPGGASSLHLTYHSPDGEEGYPGRVTTSVKYTVTDNNIFIVETEAVTDRPTPFSLTLHPYFNLGGESAGSIADHELQIYSDAFVFTDEGMTPLGRTGSVIGRSNDFRQLRNLGDAIPFLFQNHGDLYLVRGTEEKDARFKPVAAARLVHPASGRVLEVSTTEAYIQLYTGSCLDGSVMGKSGACYARHAGVCLECEGYPDGANTSSMGDIILRPGDTKRQTTAYAFSTRH